MISRFLPYRRPKVVTFDIVNSGVTVPNLTKFLHNAEKLMPFNLLKSELQYCVQYMSKTDISPKEHLLSPGDKN